MRLERVLEAFFRTFPPVATLAEADKQVGRRLLEQICWIMWSVRMLRMGAHRLSRAHWTQALFPPSMGGAALAPASASQDGGGVGAAAAAAAAQLHEMIEQGAPAAAIGYVSVEAFFCTMPGTHSTHTHTHTLPARNAASSWPPAPGRPTHPAPGRACLPCTR